MYERLDGKLGLLDFADEWSTAWFLHLPQSDDGQVRVSCLLASFFHAKTHAAVSTSIERPLPIDSQQRHRKQSTMSKPFDYSKWDNIELSDDEDDVHPNIDRESW